MIHHHPSISMEPGLDGRAIWSKTVPTGAIVFVHGFHGNTALTFKDLPRLLDSDARASAYDLFFFGYESLKVNAGAAAAELCEFLSALGSAPLKKVMVASVPLGWLRSNAFSYQRIVIVAHSLGAIVSRLALLRASSLYDGAAWLKLTELVLYAPAHLGAVAEELIRESFLGPFAVLLKARTPVLNTLAKGSRLLQQLETDTNAVLAAGGPTNHVIAARVVHSQTDNVVESDARFCGDPFADYVEQFRSHSLVCKADVSVAKPFTFLVDLL
jgi:pimeloyl-ACP methyl ester carboxylesterase